MIKIAVIASISTALVWGSFIPTLSGDTRYKDKSYQRDDNKSIVFNTKIGKMFSDFENKNRYSFSKAQEYCKNLEYSEYKDWRVPKYEEMRDLLDIPRQPVSIKHPFKNVQKGIYWSSSEDRYGNSWYTDFDLGRYSTGKNNKEFFVMCVRDKK
ncbi:MAG: DUF1566 domain-containing protein [Sulfurovum sp.]|nr:DUF1566 domain-containing protein [Sulfurovaceae bacterium]